MPFCIIRQKSGMGNSISYGGVRSFIAHKMCVKILIVPSSIFRIFVGKCRKISHIKI